MTLKCENSVFTHFQAVIHIPKGVALWYNVHIIYWTLKYLIYMCMDLIDLEM